MLVWLWCAVWMSGVAGQEYATDSARLLVNGMVDVVLGRAVRAIHSSHLNFPGLEAHASLWKLTTHQGWLGGLGSARRRGDALLLARPSGMALKLELTLDQMTLGYHHYDLRVGRLAHLQGSMAARVGHNVIDADVELDYEPCRLEVVSLEIREMGDVTLHMTGLGSFDSLYSSVSSWFTNRYIDQVRLLANAELRLITDDLMQQLDLCTKFNYT